MVPKLDGRLPILNFRIGLKISLIVIIILLFITLNAFFA